MTEKEILKKKWKDSSKRDEDLYKDFDSYKWTKGCDEELYKKKQLTIGNKIAAEMNKGKRIFAELTELYDMSKLKNFREKLEKKNE